MAISPNRFEAILDECLERVRAGEPLEVCLADHPRHAAMLRPLLELATALRQVPPPPLRRRRQAEGMARMLAHLPPPPAVRAPRQTSWTGRLAGLLGPVVRPPVRLAFQLGVAALLLSVVGLWLYALRSPAPTAAPPVAKGPATDAAQAIAAAEEPVAGAAAEQTGALPGSLPQPNIHELSPADPAQELTTSPEPSLAAAPQPAAVAKEPGPAALAPTPGAPTAGGPAPGLALAVPDPAVQIQRFTVNSVALSDGGARVTFAWATQGAQRVEILGRPYGEVELSWLVPVAGALTADLPAVDYQDPVFTLVATGQSGAPTIALATMALACDHAFFAPVPGDVCPDGPARTATGASQSFDQGFMIWLPGSDPAGLAQILVFYAGTVRSEQSYSIYLDSWDETQPALDPSLSPPTGRYQPIRGFGRVWRDEAGVRARLGWATAPEAAYEATWQRERPVSAEQVMYLGMPQGQILRLVGDSVTGTWGYLVPR